MAKWTIKVPGEAEQQVEADQLVVTRRLGVRTVQSHQRMDAGGSVGIGPGVRVIREPDFATTDTLS